MAIGDYSKISFNNDAPPPISAENLNKMDNKIDEIDKALLNIEPTVEWSDIENKPTTFTPSIHSHAWNDIESKPTTFTPATHSHAWADITSKPAFGTTGGTIAEGNHNHNTLYEPLITRAYGVLYAASKMGIINQYITALTAGVSLGVTLDATNGTITVNSTGVYDISISGAAMTASGGSAGTHTIEIRRNSETTALPGMIYYGNVSATTRLAFSVNGICNLTAGDIIKISQQTTASPSVEYFHLQLSLKRIA